MKIFINYLLLLTSLYLVYEGLKNLDKSIARQNENIERAFVVNNSKAGEKEIYQVKKIKDGDTISVVNQRGKQLEIRFACIDSPEKDQRLGEAATNHLKWLINQSNNKVTLDIVDKDNFDRQIAVVNLLHGYPVQLIQIREGRVFGYHKYKNNCPIWNLIEKEEAIAKQKKIGVWGEKSLIRPWEWRKKNK